MKEKPKDTAGSWSGKELRSQTGLDLNHVSITYQVCTLVIYLTPLKFSLLKISSVIMSISWDWHKD